jgi:hypothetical protein
MKWKDIHKQYPNQFFLLRNIVEEKLSDLKSRIIERSVFEVYDNRYRFCINSSRHKYCNIQLSKASNYKMLFDI